MSESNQERQVIINESLRARSARLIRAGLPKETVKIFGRRFIFIYFNGGSLNYTVEGKIEGITTAKGRDRKESVQLTPGPCTFNDQSVAYFENFCEAGVWYVYLKNTKGLLNGVEGILKLL